MRYFFILAGCLLLSLHPIAQTTVCLVRGDTIYAGGTDRSHIKSAGKFNFVTEGALDSTVKAMLGRIALASQDFKTLTDSFVQAVKKSYTAYFTYGLRQDPAFFDAHVMGNRLSRVVGEACLFGMENNKPVLIYIVFNMNKGIRHPVVISSTVQQQDGMAFFSPGQHPKHKGIVGNVRDHGPVGEIKIWIGIDTDGAVDGSGPPIDVLVVTKNGKKWIRK